MDILFNALAGIGFVTVVTGLVMIWFIGPSVWDLAKLTFRIIFDKENTNEEIDKDNKEI